ncbi:MAG TPA: molecular chaperone TorD family protein [Woeseiaceae bacterium]|nr:molecular chaperone TorD family protein [Woeseiaceae bacterium]
MTPDSLTITPTNDSERYIQDRDLNLTAAVRCKSYGLFSSLLASSHEIDVGKQLREVAGMDNFCVYGIDLGALCGTYLSVDKLARKNEYSRLFEIGDSGPPVAIREQQQFGQISGIREDLVRFYEFFDYKIHQHYAWAPDHISVILEFTHLLCYYESVVSEDQLSYQLAQYDFVSRHLVDWAPIFADLIDNVQPDSLYADIARSLCLFITRDHEWQASTIFPMERSGDNG